MDWTGYPNIDFCCMNAFTVKKNSDGTFENYKI